VETVCALGVYGKRRENRSTVLRNKGLTATCSVKNGMRLVQSTCESNCFALQDVCKPTK
jgi:hypothetical protein